MKEHFKSQKEQLPPVWSSSLMGQGLTEQMLKMEASARAALGPAVEQQLRAARVTELVASPVTDDSPDFLRVEAWDTPEKIQQGFAAYLDVNAAKEQGLRLPKLADAESFLKGKIQVTLTTVNEALSKMKCDREKIWVLLRQSLAGQDSKDVKGVMEQLDEDGLEAVCEGSHDFGTAYMFSFRFEVVKQ